jgi:hypothetical protein
MLKYFLPDWEDRLDPDFDFINDKYSDSHRNNPYEHDVYAHQIFKKPPYDGILFSLSVFESKISLGNCDNQTYTIRKHADIRNYLKIQKSMPLEIMGDCGAFSYVTKKVPPRPFYSVENVANLYEQLGFDYGVSVDHLVVNYVMIKNKNSGKKVKKFLSEKEKDRRIKITLSNAEKFLEIHGKNNLSFIPIGVAQGYDIDTYKKSFQALIEMGYDYIGIGSLVQHESEFILDVLKAIRPISKNVKVHLFGVLRPKFLNEFKKLGVTSFDSASFFRKAWLRSGQNYLSPNGKWYAAIRVPHVSDPRILKNLDVNGYSISELEKMEKKSLNALIKYGNGKISVDKVLDTVLAYDNLLIRDTDDGKNLKEKYRLTLTDKPWEACNCDVCRKIGIHVVIFRGCNRNKRRGFHNTWTFREMKGRYSQYNC